MNAEASETVDSARPRGMEDNMSEVEATWLARAAQALTKQSCRAVNIEGRWGVCVYGLAVAFTPEAAASTVMARIRHDELRKACGTCKGTGYVPNLHVGRPDRCADCYDESVTP